VDRPPRKFPTGAAIGLLVALAAYLALASTTARDVGVVGEVASSWLQDPPEVAVRIPDAPKSVCPQASATGSPVWSGPPFEPNAGSTAGPLEARQTRPTESLVLPLVPGRFRLPLAVNTYTGGLADWPARLLFASGGSFRLLVAMNVLFGAGLLVGVFWVARRFGSTLSASLATLVLATDWSFVYFKKVLGGTEIQLQAAGVLLLFTLWSSRVGGRWSWRLRLPVLALAIGLGISAKATFVATAVAFCVAAILAPIRRPAASAETGSPASGARPPLRLAFSLGILAALTAPLWVADLHRFGGIGRDLVVQSHDSLGLQADRLMSGLQSLFGSEQAVARESSSSIAQFFLEPLRWFHTAYGTRLPSPPWSPFRALGWLLVLAGVVLAWVRPLPNDRATRFVSMAAGLQVAALYLANRDLHHLAQAAPALALTAGCGLERLVRLAESTESRRVTTGLLCTMPLVVSGIASLLRTDAILRTLEAPGFTDGGQAELVAMLRQNDVQRLWTSDYDLYGMLEVRAPEIEVRHAWGALSYSRDRRSLLDGLLLQAEGGHYIAVRPSAPMIYDLRPSQADLIRATHETGEEAMEVDSLNDATGTWARLYRVKCLPVGGSSNEDGTAQ
jgi:hypothetical protein